MKQTDPIFSVLDLIDRPAFCVKDGIILRSNKAAQRFFLPEGAPIEPLLATGLQEYREFPSGTLHLTLNLAGAVRNASINRWNGIDLITVEPENAAADLQALALAAQTLRQPLSVISLATDTLSNTQDPEIQRQLAVVNKGIYQISRLAENMSDAYTYTVNSSACKEQRDLIALYREIFDSMEILLEKAGIRMEFDCPNDSVFGLVDKKLLERAIGNMLSNAVKFTPKGGTVRVTLVRKQNMLYLTVSDTGEGFDDSIRGNLFTQFLREPGIEDGRKGLGLGLQLIRSTASAHGGTVLICDSGNGSRITLSIAIRQERDGMLHSEPANWTDPSSHDRGLIELADVLPTAAFHPNELA